MHFVQRNVQLSLISGTAHVVAYNCARMPESRLYVPRNSVRSKDTLPGELHFTFVALHFTQYSLFQECYQELYRNSSKLQYLVDQNMLFEDM